MDIRKNSEGVLIRVAKNADIAPTQWNFLKYACKLCLDQTIEITIDDGGLSVMFCLQPEFKSTWAPACDTLHLCDKIGIDSLISDIDLKREILLAMLLSPVAFEYPSFDEFAASVRIRLNITKAARNTSLSFHTSKIERPEDYWIHAEERGFTVRPGKPLLEALRKATQPEPCSNQYSFSCYRATEYVILLGIVQELEVGNPDLLKELQRQWETRAIMSRQFHEVFLREYGSISEPLPLKFFVPGDRLWFRNPDERSSDVTGYEGSWVIYIGSGLFANFWESDKHYSLDLKCVEIYHWRNSVCRDAEGSVHIDEAIVEKNVRKTMSEPDEVKCVLEKMMQLRDPHGIYADGGCMDSSREYPRWVCPDTRDIILPNKLRID